MVYFEQKETNYLMHHGILGMRWGVRRFQNKDGSLTAEGRSRLGYRERKIEKYKSYGMTQEEAEAKYDRRKKAIMIGGGIAAGILATYGGYRLYQRVKMTKSEVDEATGLIKKAKEMSPEEDLKAINEGRRYNPFGNVGEYSNNCMLCTTAYDLRRRGFDVKAGESLHGRVILSVQDVYKDKVDWKDLGSANALKTFGDSMPEGSRGNLIVKHALLGSNHSVAWEKTKDGIIIRDGQINVSSSFGDYLNKYGYIPAGAARTDNLRINPEFLKSREDLWVRNSLEADHGELGGALITSGKAAAAGAISGLMANNKIQKMQLQNKQIGDTRNGQKRSYRAS